MASFTNDTNSNGGVETGGGESSGQPTEEAYTQTPGGSEAEPTKIHLVIPFKPRGSGGEQGEGSGTAEGRREQQQQTKEEEPRAFVEEGEERVQMQQPQQQQQLQAGQARYGAAAMQQGQQQPVQYVPVMMAPSGGARPTSSGGYSGPGTPSAAGGGLQEPLLPVHYPAQYPAGAPGYGEGGPETPAWQGAGGGPRGQGPGQGLLSKMPGELQAATAQLRSDRFRAAVAHICNAVLAIGIITLPKTLALLGWPLGLGLILAVALLSYWSMWGITRVSAHGGYPTYPELVRGLLGVPAEVLLDLALVVYSFGMMVIFYVILADITVGDAAHQGGLLHGFDFDRSTVLAVLSVIVVAPVMSFRHMHVLAGTSIIGVLAISVWGVASVVLAVAAASQGEARHMGLRPDFGDSAQGWWQVVLQAMAVGPVVLVAFTAHMTVHHVMVDLAPDSEEFMRSVSRAALGTCTALYLPLALCSYAVFGSDTRADVLLNFTLEKLQELLGGGGGDGEGGSGQAAAFTYLLVRLGFLVSIIAGLPSHMWPCRDALWRLLFRQELGGPGLLLVTYLLLLGVWGVASSLLGIWGVLQFIGSTAGVLIALIFPGMVVLTAERGDTAAIAATRTMAGFTVAVGVVLGITGLARLVLLPAPPGA